MSVGSGAAAAAAIAAESMRREEEEMTPYSPGELAGGWEFKILRANTARFRDPARFRAVLDDEARGGWVLVEKFDDYRIRLKRPASPKEIRGDSADGYDPYRTTVGMSPGAMVALIFGIVGLATVVLILLIFFLVA